MMKRLVDSMLSFGSYPEEPEVQRAKRRIIVAATHIEAIRTHPDKGPYRTGHQEHRMPLQDIRCILSEKGLEPSRAQMAHEALNLENVRRLESDGIHGGRLPGVFRNGDVFPLVTESRRAAQASRGTHRISR